eukprot:254908_1
MGGLFDYAKRAPSVPSATNIIQEYRASPKAWNTQSKRVKNCASSIELLFKDITRLNLFLRFLKSPKNDMVLKCRLFTSIDIDFKLSKLLWKFNNNTMVRVDILNINSLPELSEKDKKELSQPSHPHHTPGLNDDSNNNNEEEEEQKEEKKQAPPKPAKKQKQKNNIKIIGSYVLGIHEFYYLFLFLEDKLPELASWLMQ